MLEDVGASLACKNNLRRDRLESNSSRDCHVQVQVYLAAGRCQCQVPVATFSEYSSCKGNDYITA
jgi:hypothetical protein